MKLWCLHFLDQTKEEISLISALAYKKWLNQKSKGNFLDARAEIREFYLGIFQIEDTIIFFRNLLTINVFSAYLASLPFGYVYLNARNPLDFHEDAQQTPSYV